VQFVLAYAASASCPFRQQLQVVKADDDKVMFTAVRWSDDRDDYDEIRSHDVLAFSVDVARAIERYLDRRYRRVPRPSKTRHDLSASGRSASSRHVGRVMSVRGGLADATQQAIASGSSRQLGVPVAPAEIDAAAADEARHHPAHSSAPAFRVVAATGPLMGSVVGVSSLSFEYYGAWVSRAMGLLSDVEWGSIVATERVYNFHRLFVDAAARGKVAAIGRYKNLAVSEMTRAERAAAAAADAANSKTRKQQFVVPRAAPLRRAVPELLPSTRVRCSGAGASMRIVFVNKAADEFAA
jgi:hypothetical protein